MIVTEKAMRPASPKRCCYYCQQPIGGTHTTDCVLYRRKITLAIEIEIDVPYNSSANDVEYYYTDGNGIYELARYFVTDGNAWDVKMGDTIGEPFLDE